MGMTEWNTLRARFPDDEFDEIERIKEQYGLSYNEIIRSGVKFYMGLTMAKELIADTLEEKDIKIGGKNIGELLNSPEYQKNIEKTITKMIKILILEFFEKGMDFKEKTKSIRKERKVGRPKSQRKVGRPKQGLD
jgi:negative regulator of replication initiation